MTAEAVATPAVGLIQGLIEVQHLSKTYRTQRGDQVTALVDITFSIREGEFITCVGPSGCGKTTLLKILAGLVSKSEGTVLLRGTPVEGPRPDIGVVFQNPVLLPWWTVLENALLPAVVQKLDRAVCLARARELIRMAGLDGFEDKYPFELSGGMQQRNAIIRALIHDPALLLMDEPFGALDAMTREQMNLELLRIWRQSRKTVFFITHSIAESVFLGDRVIVMTPRPGRIVEVVPIELARPRDLDLTGSPDFGQYVTHIRHCLELKGHLD